MFLATKSSSDRSAGPANFVLVSRADPYTTRNLLDGGLCIFGATGQREDFFKRQKKSSRTSSRRDAQQLRFDQHTRTPEDAAMWQHMFAEAGRRAPTCWNSMPMAVR